MIPLTRANQPRAYEVSDILKDTALLNAQDDFPGQNRLIIQVAALPPGTTVGSSVGRYPNGQLVLLESLESVTAASGRDRPRAGLPDSPPLMGQIINATVATIARTFDLELRVAAHVMLVWLQVEYLL